MIGKPISEFFKLGPEFPKDRVFVRNGTGEVSRTMYIANQSLKVSPIYDYLSLACPSQRSSVLLCMTVHDSRQRLQPRPLALGWYQDLYATRQPNEPRRHVLQVEDPVGRLVHYVALPRSQRDAPCRCGRLEDVARGAVPAREFSIG